MLAKDILSRRKVPQFEIESLISLPERFVSYGINPESTSYLKVFNSAKTFIISLRYEDNLCVLRLYALNKAVNWCGFTFMT